MKKKILNPKREPVGVVALIPARAGKQSIKYKNLLKVGKKTLVQWAIEVAFACEKIDAVVVSTEDKKIAEEAKKLGAIVAPRPASLSKPTSGDAGFYHHAISWLEKEYGWTPELIVNLRPTSPIRFSEDIDKAIEYMQKSGADSLKTVIPAPIHPYKMWKFDSETPLKVGEAGPMKGMLDNEYRRKHGPDQPRQRIQEMFPVYWQEGRVDITRRKFVLAKECLENENVFGPNIHGFVLDPRTADIDNLEQLQKAEELYKELIKERKGKTSKKK